MYVLQLELGAESNVDVDHTELHKLLCMADVQYIILIAYH